MEGVSADDDNNNKNEKNDLMVEGIKNEFLPPFSNLNFSQQLKNILLKDCYLPKPYTRADVSNLYNLDLLGNGLIDFKRQKTGLWPSRPNYNWLNRSMNWPILWHRQFPRSNSPSSLKNSSYNLCNDHIRHLNKKETHHLTPQTLMDLQNNVNFKPENNDLLELKEFPTTDSKNFSEHMGNMVDSGNLNLTNNTALDENSINNLKNLTRIIVEQLPSLSDIYVKQSENDLTKLFNSFNTSNLLNKYENSQKTFKSNDVLNSIK